MNCSQIGAEICGMQDWSDPGGSKVVPLLDPLRMGQSLWTMRLRLTRAGGPLDYPVPCP
jgi:hypothetical protein